MKLKKSEISRIELYQSLINIFNSKEEFNKLPFNIRSAFFKFSWPKLQIEKEEGASHPLLDEVRNKIENILFDNFVVINGHNIYLDQFHGIFAMYSYLNSINLSARDILRSRADKKIQRIFESSTSILRKLDLYLKDFQVKNYLDKVSSLTAQQVFKHFCIDKKSLYTKFTLKTTVGKKRYPVILICTHSPKQEKLHLDNQIRNGYECVYFSSGNIKPIVWNENTINNDKPMPVYIQEHAIKRVFERGTLLGFERGYVHDSILRSLENPIIQGTDGPSYLIEYKYYSVKMGYFLVSKEKDCAVVRTFKFITMVGTPEFYMLKRALKGSKEDFEYLGIDSLEILLNSDVYKDEKLMGIFQRCGIGDILKLGKDIEFESPTNIIAEEIKKYFKI